MHSRPRLASIAAAASVAAVLSACSFAFATKVEGYVAEGQRIAFNFYRQMTDRDPTDFRIVDFTIREMPSRTIVWALKGDASIRTVTVGEVPEGLEQSGTPMPLRPGLKYRASVTAQPRYGAIGYSGVTFEIRQDGKVITVPIADGGG
jgi:hypothetical protein